MKISFKEDMLWINGKQIELPAVVDKTLCVGEKVLVLLMDSKTKVLTHLTRPHANSNVVCFDKDGNWLWEIEHRSKTLEESSGGGYNPYHKLEEIPGKTDQFKAWGGDFWVIADMNTGKWLKYVFTK